MAPRFLTDLKNFCCCIPTTDDDAENLIGNENDSDWVTASRTIIQNRYNNLLHLLT